LDRWSPFLCGFHVTSSLVTFSKAEIVVDGPHDMIFPLNFITVPGVDSMTKGEIAVPICPEFTKITFCC
jgi:hypothetical protein